MFPISLFFDSFYSIANMIFLLTYGVLLVLEDIPIRFGTHNNVIYINKWPIVVV